MRSGRNIAFLLGIILLCTVARAQDDVTRLLTQPVDWKTTASVSGLIFQYNVQMVNSSVYFRRDDGSCPTVEVCPIVRIDADGKENSIDLTKVPDTKSKVYVRTWFVNPDGSFYAIDLFYQENTYYIVSYDANSKFQWKARMSERFTKPDVIVPLANGESFLVSGTIVPPDDKFARLAKTALYDRTGKMMQELTLPTDSTAAAVTFGTRSYNISPMARVAIDSDGLVYLMRQAAQPKVQVLSPSGELLRTVDLAFPEGVGWPMDIYADRGRIVVVHTISSSEPSNPLVARAIPYIVFYDSVTGKPTAQRDYAGPGTLISLRDGNATFLNSKGDNFSIGHALVN